MARHRSFEEKKYIVDYYLNHGDIEGTAEKFDIGTTTLQDWIKKYFNYGEASLVVRSQHTSYSSDFKQMVAHEYLQGDDSYQTLALKYNIPAGTTVRKWVLQYTEGKKTKSTFGGSHTMTKSRKTTYEERLKIAEYEESHDITIRELSELFEVSYQQAYSYVKKYQTSGAYGLEDKRGKRKPKSDWTEIDQLKRELEIERRKRRKVEVENAFLKKLEELERRRK